MAMIVRSSATSNSDRKLHSIISQNCSVSGWYWLPAGPPGGPGGDDDGCGRVVFVCCPESSCFSISESVPS